MLIRTIFSQQVAQKKGSSAQQETLLKKEMLGDLCKVHGVVTKVVDWSSHYENQCSSVTALKLTSGNNDYIVGWYGNRMNAACDKSWNGFENESVPKVGDEVYALAKWKNSEILKVGEASYNSYKSIPVCNMPLDGETDEDYQYFFNTDKCRVSGIVENITRTNADGCGFGLRLSIKANDGMHYISAREAYANEQCGALCSTKTFQWSELPLWNYGLKGEIINYYFPKIGDKMYLVVDKKGNYVMKYGQQAYNEVSQEPLCIPSLKEQSFTGDLSNKKVALIQEAVKSKLIQKCGTGSTKTTSGKEAESMFSLLPIANASSANYSNQIVGGPGIIAFFALIAFAGMAYYHFRQQKKRG